MFPGPRLALLVGPALLVLVEARPASAQGVMVDPAFKALQPAPRQGPDLAPGPLEVPAAIAASPYATIRPGLDLAPGLPGGKGPAATLPFADAPGSLYDGTLLEAPLTDRGITGRATIPF